VEDLSKGPMLRFEDSLPLLPVPTLEETAKRYLKSLHPLLSKSEFEHSQRAVNEFIKPGAHGEELQTRLRAHRNTPGVKNWIYEWWNNDAYLAYRDPIVPYVSYFYSHRDDRKRRDPVKRAAAITTAVLEVKKLIDTKQFEPEYMRKQPIAMQSYELLFNTCRIPAKPADYPVKYDFKEHKHIIVVRKNQYFKVMHEVGGKQLNTTELEEQFRKIYKTAEQSPAIGTLTTQHRDIWTDVRERLINASPVNKASLETIQSASFIVCLDDASPVTLEERAHQFWHGDPANRFNDAPCQFIITDNAKSGYAGEHSMVDGSPTYYVNQYALKLIATDALDFSNPELRSNLPEPAPLRWDLTPELLKDIEAATSHFNGQIASHDLKVLAYQGYGSKFIKSVKCSPDAFVQMALQLAYKKMYGVNRPTYESATTRKYQLGRTETTRSVSDESVAFCNAMEDSNVDDETRIKLLRAALSAHVKYIGDASEGKGVDRHLFGLKKCMKPGEPTPAIFADPANSYSSTWFISSSQLSSEFFNGYGWAEVISSGWG
jgi:carnitine O-acetyltransferase